MWAIRASTGQGSAARRWRAAALLALGLLVAGPVADAAEALTESQVKAAYLYNFAKFVEWPAEAFTAAQAAFVLCVPGTTGLGGALSGIDGKPVQGRPLQVRRNVRPDELKACHLLFVPESEEHATAEWLRRAGTLPVLTVGASEGFAAAGGVIGFVTGEERVQFEINPDAAGRVNLKISSQLLKLATIVHDARRRAP